MKKNNRNGCPTFARVVCAGATLLVLGATTNLQAQYNYTTFNVPGAGPTTASGISGDDIVGYYWNGSSYQGFLYNGSSYMTLSVPGAKDTMAEGISGTNIVGYYFNSSGYQEGFLYNGSSYTVLSVPGAEDTYAWGISGTNIVGYCYISTTDYGFLATPITAPTVSIQPQTRTVTVGNPAVFNTTASGTLPLSFQWLFSGTNIPGATNSTLTISNAFPVNQGLYAIVVTNFYDCVTSAPAMLTVSPLALTAPQSVANSQFQFTFGSATGVNYSVQYTTSLSQADWIPLFTFEGDGEPITVIDPNAAGSSQRFYRVILSPQ